MQHLWEVSHPYYCNEGNYFAGHADCPSDDYGRWQDFIEEYADSDFDMNLLLRFDWIETDGDGKDTYNGDDYYRNGILKVFWMGQRKGLYSWSTVKVCRADEPAVIAFLKPRWEHMRTLWAPIAEGEMS